MILKFLIGALAAYGMWRLWQGFNRPLPGAPKPPPPRLDDEDAAARRVLGVGADDGADAIRAAHRRLVTATHPDRGGSEELVRQVNAARDRLLGTRNQ